MILVSMGNSETTISTIKDPSGNIVAQKFIQQTFQGGKLISILDSNLTDTVRSYQEYEYQDTLLKKITVRNNGVFDSSGLITLVYTSDGKPLTQVRFKANGDTDFVHSAFLKYTSGSQHQTTRDEYGNSVTEKWNLTDNCGYPTALVMRTFTNNTTYTTDTLQRSTYFYSEGCNLSYSVGWANMAPGQVGSMVVFSSGKPLSITQYSEADTTKGKARTIYSYLDSVTTQVTTIALDAIGDTLDIRRLYNKVTPKKAPLIRTSRFRGNVIKTHEEWSYNAADSLVSYRSFGMDSIEILAQHTAILRDSLGRVSKAFTFDDVGDTASVLINQYYP
jgi:hypothetical protein